MVQNEKRLIAAYAGGYEICESTRSVYVRRNRRMVAWVSKRLPPDMIGALAKATKDLHARRLSENG